MKDFISMELANLIGPYRKYGDGFAQCVSCFTDVTLWQVAIAFQVIHNGSDIANPQVVLG